MRLCEDTFENHNRFLHEMVAHTPGAGHIKAAVHEAAGDGKEAERARRKANASWDVVKGVLPSAAGGYGVGALSGGPILGCTAAAVFATCDTLKKADRAVYVQKKIEESDNFEEQNRTRSSPADAADASTAGLSGAEVEEMQALRKKRERLVAKKNLRELREYVAQLEAEEAALSGEESTVLACEE